MSSVSGPIAIVGAGAVGSILAAHLGASGEAPLLCEQDSGRAEQLRRGALRVTGKVELALREPRLLPSLEALARHRPRAVLLCTKTPALRSLLPPLAAALAEAPQALVVGMQNGIGVEDELARYFPEERVARGIVNFAGTLDAASGVTVLHWLTPPSYLCPLSEAGRPAADELAAALSRTGLETLATPAEETRKWVFFKAVLNAALNALCASTGLTMHQAMNLSHTRRLAELLVREGLSVAAACGHHYGENALEECIRYLDDGGDHLPSMWTDLERGLPTEIEHVNGKLVKLGLAFKNVDVAVNHYFTAVVIAREIASGARRPDDIPDYLRRS